MIYSSNDGGLLNQALGNLGQGVGEFQKQRRARMQESALADAMALIDWKTPEGRQAAFDYGLRSGQLDDVMKISSFAQNLQEQLPLSIDERDNFVSLLQRLGIENASDWADLYQQSSTGGRTAIVNHLLDTMSRRGSMPQAQQIQQIDEQIQMQAEEEVEPEPQVMIFEGLNPKERANLKRDLLKDNSKRVETVTEQIKASDRNLNRFNSMERLNNSGKLPEGTGTWNVDLQSGELRIARAANPETQSYVKLVNDFTTEAKNSYGARVTNFELNRFLKRLPTLANTEDGRRMIIDHMRTMEALDRMEQMTLRDVYREKGVQNIDFTTAQQIAEYRLKQSPEHQRLLERANNMDEVSEDFNAKKGAKAGYVATRDPSNRIKMVPEDKLEIAIEKGYRVL